jgi:hypothetical protein
MRLRKYLCSTASFASFVVIALITAGCTDKSDLPANEGDLERVPAELFITLKAGKYEIERAGYEVLDIRHSGSFIRLEDFFPMSSAGDPALPRRIYEIAVPPNIDWDSLKLTVKPGKVVTLPSTYDILPAAPVFAPVISEETAIWGAGKDIKDGRNLNVYARDRFYPDELVSIVSQSQLRKWKIVKLAFSPVRYNPVSKTVRVVESVDVRLSYMRIGREEYRADPLLADTLADDEARERFINFKEAQEWYRHVPARKDDSGAVADPDYVIITTNAIRDNSNVLTDFVAHKTVQGRSVLIVTEDQYGVLTGQAPDGTAEKIRQWLIDNYQPLGINYVLLIGDPDPDDPTDPGDSIGDVPMKMTWPEQARSGDWEANYEEWVAPSDAFYADLTGNWDLDGDGFFAENAWYPDGAGPDPAITPDSYSIRWAGKIDVASAGSYRFSTLSDNGIRLIIDGAMVVDNWTSHVLQQNSGTIDLAVGQHDIQLDYYNDTGDAVIGLYWRPPGSYKDLQIPSNRLLHLQSGSYVFGGLSGEYFNNPDFTASALTRVDSEIQFFWGADDKGPNGVEFDNEVYVGRIPVYDNDYVALDDILQKIIDYENDASPAWRNSLLQAYVDMDLGPGVSSNHPLGEAIKNDYADSLGFTNYRAYESNSGISPPPECPAINPKDPSPTAPCNLLGEWANGGGYGLLTWETHGALSNPPLFVTASQLLESGDHVHLDDTTPAFAFHDSCYTGYPEYAFNLGYQFLQQGAIATVSASRLSTGAIFTPPWDPSPQTCNSTNLDYYFSGRMMQGYSVGRALQITKSKCATNSTINQLSYNIYGDPSTALFQTTPGIVLLFDTSGSMSWSHEGVQGVPIEEQRLSLAKEAVYPFMELLREHANTRANFGIAGFPFHPWDLSEGCTGQLVSSMAEVNDATIDAAINTTIPSLVPGGNTPLLAGLSTASAMMGDEKPRAIVLLSDGYQNCPPFVTGYDNAVSSLIDSLNAQSTQVYTIGFGRPTDVDHELLSRLATETGGEFFDVTTAAFNPASWSPATELHATYKSILVDAMALETALDPTAIIQAGQPLTRNVRISRYDRKVSFLLSWESPDQNRLQLQVTTSDGSDVPLTGATASVSLRRGKTYELLTVDRAFLRRPGKVGATPWVVEIVPSGLDAGETENIHYSVIMDSAVKMDTSFSKKSYRVGDAIVVMSKMSAGGRPMLGVSDASVKVTRPKVGINNWLSSYHVSKRELQKIPEMRQDELLSPVARKAIYLADVKKIPFDGRTSPIEHRMYDDGSHGDIAANDGIYTATITDTPREGTYSFYVRASGAIGAGGFEREHMVQKHLAINSSSLKVPVDISEIEVARGIKRYKIAMTPKDNIGNYYGPGRARSISVSTTQGKIFGGINDHLDGTYSLLVDLPQDVDLKETLLVGEVKGAKFAVNFHDELTKEDRE